ncbi:unnamed protein product [Phytophthora lilii]|uniref:Unnamed protein product n=1 Tax=Phytophthora lilii TaxID=2077276 RepID=A0A9W6TUE8_9STRA|nr:unnamed protein product [Phytophthora lilii]
MFTNWCSLFKKERFEISCGKACKVNLAGFVEVDVANGSCALGDTADFDCYQHQLKAGYEKLLLNKTAATMLAALKAFVHLHTVNILTSDNGSEFMNSQAQEFFQAKKIEHYNNEPGDHGTIGKIERFNRTLSRD